MLKSLLVTIALLAPALASSATFQFRVATPGLRSAAQAPAPAGNGGTAELQLSKPAIDFGTVDVNETSTQSVTLTNVGDGVASSLSFGSVSAPYTLTSDCGPSLLAGDSCNLSIQYAPTTAALASALLTVSSGEARAESTLAGTGHLQIETIAVAAGDPNAMLLAADGTMWQTGDGSYTGFARRNVFLPTMSGVSKISAGSDMSLVIKSDKSLWIAGQATYGANGSGSLTHQPGYRQVFSSAAAMSGHYVASFAVSASGTLYFTGSNMYRMKGDGSGYGTFTSFTGTGMANVKAVTSSNDNVLVLKTDGSLWGAGSNEYGQLLGTPTSTRVATFKQLTTNVQAFALNAGTTAVVKTDGTLWMAGRNGGVFGDGTTANSATLKQIAGMTGVKSVVGSSYTTYVLKTDGTVWATGDNSYGNFGNGSLASQTSFTKVFEGAAKLMEPGHTTNSMFLIDIKGKLWAAGRGAQGVTGLGTWNDTPTFTRVRY